MKNINIARKVRNQFTDVGLHKMLKMSKYGIAIFQHWHTKHVNQNREEGKTIVTFTDGSKITFHGETISTA